jgi:monoamine oxidase
VAIVRTARRKRGLFGMAAQFEADVIVIGGGVAGLAAARELALKKRTVILIEARDRLGGRILTQRLRGLARPVELGAEFIHEGNAPLWKIVRGQRLRTVGMPGRHWHFREGELARMDDLAERIERVTSRIDAKRIGAKSFARFLGEQRGQVSDEDGAVAAGFVEGFEAAPMDRMSARALAGTTLDDEKQFLLPGGYDGVVKALADALPAARVRVVLSEPVRAVKWRRGAVSVVTRNANYVATAAVVTLPLGVLQAKPSQRGAVRFDPPLRAQEKIWKKMGMGHVIRLVLRFDPGKWRRLVPAGLRRKNSTGFGFIHSRIPGVPVWWSLRGDSVVTGWAGGPAALAFTGRSRRAIFERALSSLARILGRSRTAIRFAVRGWEAHDWSRDAFSRGAYSFTAAGQDDAPRRLREPVGKTLFFAGEATAEGEETGTVHGALASGLRAAQEVDRRGR